MKSICNEERRLQSREHLSTAAPIFQIQKIMACIEDLPEPVMVDILSRLGVKTIIDCKCVCKQWWNMISESYFADVQLSRSPARFMIYTKHGILKCAEVEDHHNLHHDPVMSLDIKFAPLTRMVGSCNGLVCLWQFNKKHENIYICNPITREYLILPRPRQQDYRKGYRHIVCCFGVASLTLEYKMIRIFPSDPDFTRTFHNFEVEVYTLGTGRWRSLGHVSYCFNRCYGTFLNGHAHWSILDEKICAFDMEKETFDLFPSPPSESRRIHLRRLDVLKGCLCVCDTSTSKLTIWVMKEYRMNKSWHKEIVIRKGVTPDVTPNLDHMLFFQPPRLIEVFKDGTILMASSSNNHLLLYSPWNKTIIDTEKFDGHFHGALAYRPCFHRLHKFENERVESVLKLSLVNV